MSNILFAVLSTFFPEVELLGTRRTGSLLVLQLKSNGILWHDIFKDFSSLV